MSDKADNIYISEIFFFGFMMKHFTAEQAADGASNNAPKQKRFFRDAAALIFGFNFIDHHQQKERNVDNCIIYYQFGYFNYNSRFQYSNLDQ